MIRVMTRGVGKNSKRDGVETTVCRGLTAAYTHTTFGQKMIRLVTELNFLRLIFDRLHEPLRKKVDQE